MTSFNLLQNFEQITQCKNSQHPDDIRELLNANFGNYRLKIVLFIIVVALGNAHSYMKNVSGL